MAVFSSTEILVLGGVDLVVGVVYVAFHAALHMPPRMLCTGCGRARRATLQPCRRCGAPGPADPSAPTGLL